MTYVEIMSVYLSQEILKNTDLSNTCLFIAKENIFIHNMVLVY
jgi:hypothetical protein